jgi:biotin carboxylase
MASPELLKPVDAETILVCGFGSGMERSVPQIVSMGYQVVAVKDGDTTELEALGVHVVHADPCNAEEVLRRLQNERLTRFAGVLSLGQDNPETISALAKAMQCRRIPRKVAHRCTRKDLRLQCLRNAGLNTPTYQLAHTASEAMAALVSVGLPAIVKPVDGTSSRGVALVCELAQAGEVVSQAFHCSLTGAILVEKYLEGTEHTVTAFCVNGRFQICGFADRAYDGKFRFFPHVFESGDTLPSELPIELQERVCCEVRRAVDALELDPAFINTDVLVTSEGHVYLLEVTARLTGARIATEVMRLSSGVDPLPNIVRLAVGAPLEWEELRPTRIVPVVQRFLPCTGGVVEYIAEIEVPPGVHDLFWCRPLEQGLRLPHYRSADDMIAGAIACGATVAHADATARSALASLPLRIRNP